MAPDDSDSLTLGDTTRDGVAFAVGLLLMGYAALTYWQYAYMVANPDVGSISTSTPGVVVHLVMFLAGATVVFNAATSGLARALEESRTEAA